MKRKKVLLLCATHNELSTIKALRKLGFYIIVTGNVQDLPGQKYADKYIQADYSDKELILKIAKQLEIHLICQCSNDFGIYTASYVAETLGLPGYDSYETGLLLHNKEKFKEFALKHNIPTPKFSSFEDCKSALEWSKNENYPLIVKPSDFFAGRGTNKVDNFEQMQSAIEDAFANSRNKVILIEQFIDGSQHGFATFLKDRKVVAHCCNDEYSILNPYRVEIDTFPATNYNLYAKRLIQIVEKIAEILGLVDGIFHMQYMVMNDEVYIIEVMRRNLGNMYFVPGNMLTNINWDYWETRAKCGLSCEGIPNKVELEGFYAYKTVLATSNGVIKSIEIPDYYQKYLMDFIFIKSKLDEITDYKSQPIGLLFLMFSSQDEMYKFLIEEYKNDIVVME